MHVCLLKDTLSNCSKPHRSLQSSLDFAWLVLWLPLLLLPWLLLLSWLLLLLPPRLQAYCATVDGFLHLMTRNIQRALFFCVMSSLQDDWNSAIHKVIMPASAAGTATGLAAGLNTNSVAGLTADSPGLQKSRMSPCIAPGPFFVPKHEVVQASCASMTFASVIMVTGSGRQERLHNGAVASGAGAGSRSCRGCDGMGRSCRGSDDIGSGFCFGRGIGRRTCRACSDIGVGGVPPADRGRSCRGCDGMGRSCRGSDDIGSGFCFGRGIGSLFCSLFCKYIRICYMLVQL
jgi:hypothetical protein